MTRTLPIAEIAEVNPRTPSALSEDHDREVNFVPMSHLSESGVVTANGTRPLREVSKGYTYFANGDVLVAKITPCMENGKAAFVNTLPTGVGFGSTEFHVLRPRKDVDGRYLFYMVWNPHFRQEAARNMTGSAGQKRIPASFFERFEIPLPPLSEQRRIADILDKADGVRRKRREAVNRIEEVLHSAFMNIVGPGAHDYHDWPKRSVESLADQAPGSMRTGPFGSDLKHSEFVSEGIAVLGIDNAVQNRFAWGEARHITPAKYEKLERYTVRPNDVIVTIMGTTGRSAVVPEDIPTAITTKHLACITLCRDEAEPEFISNAIHRHPAVLSQIGVAHRGAIMPGLNLTLIKSLELHVPPISRQREFTAVVDGLRAIESQLQSASTESDRLFNSLAQRAFRGKL